MLRRFWTKSRVAYALGLLWVCSLVACYWIARNPTAAPTQGGDSFPTAQENQTSCRIVLLQREKRLNPDRVPGYYFRPTPSPFDRPFPLDQVDNPVLFQERYATVQFVNTARRPLTLYCVSLLWWPLDAELRASLKASIAEIRDERMRTRDLVNMEESWTPSLRDVAILDVEVRGEDGSVVQPYTLHQSLADPSVPPPKQLIEEKRPAFVFQPGEGVELPMRLFGKLRSREVGLKPGTYTIRATVSYAEAPSGETKRVTSEPVTITVTEEHIKAAEAFWNAKP